MERNQLNLEPEVMDKLMDLAQMNGCSVEKMVVLLIQATDGPSVAIPTNLATAQMFNTLAILEASGDPKRLPTTIFFERLVARAARSHQVSRLLHGTELHPFLPQPTLP